MVIKLDEELNLTDMEFDALREVGNVGVGNAVTALSKVLNKKIAIDIPKTDFVLIKEFCNLFGGPEKMLMSIYLKMSGDLKGETLFFFTKENALLLVDLMAGNEPGTTKEFDDFAMSAFGEMSNIFSGAYLSALSNMLGYKVLPGIPNMSYDMVGSIVDAILVRRSLVADEILCINTNINVEGQNVEGNFVLMFDVESLNKVLKSLKEKYGVG